MILQQSSYKYNPHLDGLRGIAILMVLSFHFLEEYKFFNIGWSGVDLFFIISGYLLTGRLFTYKDDKAVIIKFYFNRFLRIIPLYALFLLLFFFAIYFLISKNNFTNLVSYKNNILGIAFFMTNWLLIKHQIPSLGYLGHLWSLAVEEQFYLILPWFVIYIKSIKKQLLIAIISVIIILIFRNIYYFIFLTKGNILNIYWNTFLRADSFFTGIILYIVTSYYKLNFKIKYLIFAIIISVVSILIGGLSNNSFRITPFFVTIGFTLINIFFSCIILLLLSDNKNFAKRITNLRFLKFTGKISFGMYIIHWPLFLVGFGVLNTLNYRFNLNMSGGLMLKINIIASFLITYILSVISFKYYESIFLKLKYK